MLKQETAYDFTYFFSNRLIQMLPVQTAVKLLSNQTGFEQVTRQLDTWLASGQYQRLVLGHEPTGIYHENWARALLQRYAPYQVAGSCPQVDYRFLNPLLVKRFRKMHPELDPPVPLMLSKPLERQTIQALWRHCPNPHHFRQLGQAGIQAFSRRH